MRWAGIKRWLILSARERVIVSGSRYSILGFKFCLIPRALRTGQVLDSNFTQYTVIWKGQGKHWIQFLYDTLCFRKDRASTEFKDRASTEIF